MSNSEKTIKSNLEHDTDRHDSSLDDIIRKLSSHEIQPDDIPDDVQKTVDKEIRRHTKMSLQEWWGAYHAGSYEVKKAFGSNNGKKDDFEFMMEDIERHTPLIGFNLVGIRFQRSR